MTTAAKILLWLDAMAGISSAYIGRIFEVVDDPAELYNNTNALSDRIIAVSNKDCYNKMLAAHDSRLMTALIKDIERADVTLVALTDPEYPALLRQIPQPPGLLYCKGDIGLLRQRSIAVVGTRTPSRYGREVTAVFAAALAKCGLCVVAGLARGIDSVAHEEALKNGKTIAVLGCGIDKVYPAENFGLYKRIAEDGLIISEYGLGAPANAYHFPARNRIISGLSEGVLITEAGLKSGSLITADCALSQGRELYCIPSNITSKQGLGSNALIKEAQGMIVTAPDDILSVMGITPKKSAPSAPLQLDVTEQIVITALESGELHFEELLIITGLAVSELNSLLGRMELLSLITKTDNNNYQMVTL